MATSNHSGISRAQGIGMASVSIFLPLAASISMAARWLSELGQGTDQYMLFAVAGSIILSSVILGRLTGLTIANRAPFWIPALLVVVWLGVILFSTSTSTLALLTSGNETISRQSQQSAKYRQLADQIQANRQAQASLQANIDKLPATYVTKRAEQLQQLQVLQRDGRTLISMQSAHESSGQGSAVAASFAKLERFGISRLALALLVAVLLDTIPFAVAMSLGYLSGGRRLGKPSATVSPLRAVA